MVHLKNILNRMMGLSLLASLGFVVLGFTGPNAALAAGPAPVDLLSAGNFVILAETGITNTGSHATVITGDIGNSPGTAAQMDGVWCSEITGTIYGVNAAYTGSGATTCFAGNPPLANKTLVDNAVGDMVTAYNNAALVVAPAPVTELGAGNISGMILAPGLYKWSTGVLINTSVTLSGGANDVWIFQISGDLSIDSGGSVPAGIKVLLSGGAQASNVFWQVGGATGATLGTYSTFNGTILSAKQVILQTGAVLNGRALAQTQVVLDANNVTLSQALIPGSPTLSKIFDPAAIIEGCGASDFSTLTITLSNPNSADANLTAPLTDTLPSGVVIAATPNASTTCGGFGAVSAIAGASTVTLPATFSIPASGSCIVQVDVCAANAGSYPNTLAADALQTDQGNNTVQAIATLIVNPPAGPGAVAPTVSKSFDPATINGGTSTLTIILYNSSTDTPDTNATLTDNLPPGLVIANSNIFNDCGGTLTAPAGTGTIVLSGGTIPVSNGSIPGTCMVQVDVTAAIAGSYVNTLAAGDLQTDQGDNAELAIATLIVTSSMGIPTLNEWGMIIFMALAGLGSVYYLKKRRRV